MPPKADKKPKEKQIKGAEAEQMVLEYMRSTNRPYSSTEVSANLKNVVGKTEAGKALASLAEQGSITAKPYGKQTIFVYNQTQLDVLSPEEMATLDEQAKVSKEELEARKKELKSLQSELSSKLSTPKTPDIAKAIQEMKLSNEKLVQALSAYRGESAAPPMSVEEMSKIDKDWTVWRKLWVERKKTYKEAIGMLQEGNVISAKQADWEEDQGIEIDDDEAIEVENGEFVKAPAKPTAFKSKTTASAHPGSSTLGKHPRTASTSTAGSKRSRSSAGSV